MLTHSFDGFIKAKNRIEQLSLAVRF